MRANTERQALQQEQSTVHSPVDLWLCERPAAAQVRLRRGLRLVPVVKRNEVTQKRVNAYFKMRTCFSCNIVQEAHTNGFARLLSLQCSRRTIQSSRLVVPSNTHEHKLVDAV